MRMTSFAEIKNVESDRSPPEEEDGKVRTDGCLALLSPFCIKVDMIVEPVFIEVHKQAGVCPRSNFLY